MGQTDRELNRQQMFKKTHDLKKLMVKIIFLFSQIEKKLTLYLTLTSTLKLVSYLSLTLDLT